MINFHYNHSLDYIVPKCKAYFLTSYIQPGKAIFNANHNIFPYIQYPVWKNPPFICIFFKKPIDSSHKTYIIESNQIFTNTYRFYVLLVTAQDVGPSAKRESGQNPGQSCCCIRAAGSHIHCILSCEKERLQRHCVSQNTCLRLPPPTTRNGKWKGDLI